MSHKVYKRPRAKQDLIGHYSRIALDKVEPAERFLRVAEEAFERLAAMPGVGRAWRSADPRLAEVRVYPMPARFRNYLVFYRPLHDGIEVLAVLHGARNLQLVLEQIAKDEQEEPPQSPADG